VCSGLPWPWCDGGCSSLPPSGVKDQILKDTEVRRGKKGSVSDTLTSVEDFSSDF
jgi:hypothetical protein